jgi:hypothetical protein
MLGHEGMSSNNPTAQKTPEKQKHKNIKANK